jgi:hypothetical protein
MVSVRNNWIRIAVCESFLAYCESAKCESLSVSIRNGLRINFGQTLKVSLHLPQTEQIKNLTTLNIQSFLFNILYIIWDEFYVRYEKKHLFNIINSQLAFIIKFHFRISIITDAILRL